MPRLPKLSTRPSRRTKARELGFHAKTAPTPDWLIYRSNRFLPSVPSLARSVKLAYRDRNTDVLPSACSMSATLRSANQGSAAVCKAALTKAVAAP
jgi:hypothetical protein